METFTIGLSVGWFTRRIKRRNPLVRISDRIEVAIAALWVVVALTLIPFAAAVGTAVYDSQSQMIARNSTSVWQIDAHADADAQPLRTGTATVVYLTPISWISQGTWHSDTVESSESVSQGNRVPVWVDTSGNRVDPPSTVCQAVMDAVVLAALSWFAAVAVLGGGVLLTVRVLNRWRLEAWDSELRTLLA